MPFPPLLALISLHQQDELSLCSCRNAPMPSPSESVPRDVPEHYRYIRGAIQAEPACKFFAMWSASRLPVEHQPGLTLEIGFGRTPMALLLILTTLALCIRRQSGRRTRSPAECSDAVAVADQHEPLQMAISQPRVEGHQTDEDVLNRHAESPLRLRAEEDAATNDATTQLRAELQSARVEAAASLCELQAAGRSKAALLRCQRDCVKEELDLCLTELHATCAELDLARAELTHEKAVTASLRDQLLPCRTAISSSPVSEVLGQPPMQGAMMRQQELEKLPDQSASSPLPAIRQSGSSRDSAQPAESWIALTYSHTHEACTSLKAADAGPTDVNLGAETRKPAPELAMPSIEPVLPAGKASPGRPKWQAGGGSGWSSTSGSSRSSGSARTGTPPGDQRQAPPPPPQQAPVVRGLRVAAIIANCFGVERVKSL